MSRRFSEMTTSQSTLRLRLLSTCSTPFEETSDTESSDKEYVPEPSTEVASGTESADEDYIPESASEVGSDAESLYAEYVDQDFEPESLAAQRCLFLSEIWLTICDFLSESDVSSVSHTDRFRRSLLRIDTSYIFRRNVIYSKSSCLPYVAERGDLALVRTMQKYPGFRADARDCDGDTALLSAIQLGHIDVALALIETDGRHVNMRNGGSGWRPLTLAIRNHEVEVVRRLILCHNIKVNGVSYTDYGRPLLDACIYGNPEILDLILGCPTVDVSVRDELGQMPLHVAAAQNQPAILDILVNDGRFALSAIDANGWNVMDVAIHLGNYDVIEVMRTHGIIPTSSQVHYAQNRRRFKSKLIDGDLDRPDPRATGSTMITCAAGRGHLDLVSLFLPNASAKQKRDALLLASAYGHIEVSKLLLQYVNSNFNDSNGRTPRWYARRWGHYAIVSLLDDSQTHKKRKRDVDDTGREEGSKRNPIIID